jgi:small-conductance mechanosensitive channel
LDPDSPLPSLMGTYWFWYPALVLFPIVMLMRGLSGYLYTARVESVNFPHSLRLLFAVVLLNALVQRWLLVVCLRLAKEAASASSPAIGWTGAWPSAATRCGFAG